MAEKSVEIAQISLDNYDGIYTGVIQDYKGPKGEYDVVYCMRASWCISGFEEVIIKMADMCRGKGTIIFDIMPVEKYSIFKEIINRNFLKWVGVVKIDSPEFCYYSLNKIKKMLRKMNFDVRLIKEEDIFKEINKFNAHKIIIVADKKTKD